MSQANSTQRVVIIIPTYNERPNIESLLPVLLKTIFPKAPKRYEMHALVVDDSSPDGTAEVVRKQTSNSDRIHLLINKQKGGLGKAYLAGMEYALTSLHADIVFEFDADFSHDPKKIIPMLNKLDQGHDLVLGSRYITGGSIPKNWGLHRKFLSVLGNKVIQLIVTNFSIQDWTTGYRAIRKEVLTSVLPEMHEEQFTGYTFQIGFLHKTIRKGFSVAEIPIHFVDRTHGHSKLGAEYIKNTLSYILKVRINELKDLRIVKFALVGVIGAVVQLSSLQLLRSSLAYQLAYFSSVEAAVVSNFIWSNLWTFADRKLTASQVPLKFLQFNLGSAGSIAIQQLLAFGVEKYIGLVPLFIVPLLNMKVDTGLLAAVVGILLGMIWNYVIYSKLIWKQSAHD